MGLVIGCALEREFFQLEKLYKYIKTPTDVLRIASSLSGGDVSLAENTKFISFKRPIRRFLLACLESFDFAIVEEMVKYKNRWIKLGERLHPGEFKKHCPKTFNAFGALRNGDTIITFNSKVEFDIINNNVDNVIGLLSKKPGEFARRLDHLIRKSNLDDQIYIVNKFIDVADKVSTPVLLQVKNHFDNRNDIVSRTIFPKGQLAKFKVIDGKLPNIDQRVCNKLRRDIDSILIKRFSSLKKLGNIYLDPKLKNYLVPFSQRSASKAMKTIVRGSKLDLDFNEDTIRFFIWWKNLNQNQVKPENYNGTRVDIDLSAVILDKDFKHKSDLSYYNLRDFAGHHSGDITNAPEGACEFIDVSMNKVKEYGGRYIVMCINSYTSTPLCDLPECFAGWMGRQNPNSGEIFEAKTVKNKVDLTSNTTVSIPLLIDVVERKVIWVDLALKARPSFSNNVRNNSNNIALLCKAMVNLKKTTLHDLFSLHIQGRGKLVDNPKNADIVFSEEKETQYQLDVISADYL